MHNVIFSTLFASGEAAAVIGWWRVGLPAECALEGRREMGVATGQYSWQWVKVRETAGLHSSAVTIPTLQGLTAICPPVSFKAS